jgi:hypothetical protein
MTQRKEMRDSTSFFVYEAACQGRADGRREGRASFFLRRSP